VLEVGILHYEFALDRFVIQILLRFIDAKSGEVIGKAKMAKKAHKGWWR